MKLSQLAEFISKRRKEFEEAVSQEAKKISFTDVTKEIHFETWPILNSGWEDGERLEFLLSQGHYAAIVDRDTLLLRGNYGIEIAKFSGSEVREYYDSLSTTILNAKQEYLENLPF